MTETKQYTFFIEAEMSISATSEEEARQKLYNLLVPVDFDAFNIKDVIVVVPSKMVNKNG